MALVTAANCKAYCRVQGSAEDALFAIFYASAFGQVQSYLRRPILAELRTFRLPRPDVCNTDTLILPVYPVSLRQEDSDSAETVAAAVITNGDDETVDAEEYHLDERIGVFTATTGHSFTDYPYTITATVGLSAHPDYATVIEPVINAAILDLVADKWARRNPAATNESEGGGVGTSYAETGIPKRISDTLDPWRMARAL